MMPLKESQKIIFDQIVDSICNKGIKRIKLIGSAGTGKTYLVAALVEYFLTKSGNKPVYCTAPTNKAVAVIKQKVQFDDPKLQFCTTHSACQVTLYTDNKTGERKFVANKYIPRNIDKYHVSRSYVLIIDETSMLNTDFVGGYKMVNGKLEYVKGYLEDFSFPIIFVGDDKQINPVGEAVSPIWEKDYLTFRLTEIIRQGLGNPIIDLSNDTDMVFFKKPKIIEGVGYKYNNDRWDLISDLAQVNGTDELKYLAWTNKGAGGVDEVNQAVRQEIYGEFPKKIEKLETIVFDAPYGTFYTNQETKCEQVALITSYINLPTIDTKILASGEVVGRVDKLRLKYYRINDKFDVVHEDSTEIYNLVAKYLKENCIKYAWAWKPYYWFMDRFAIIKYNHAISVHKSQGSTYNHTILNIGNIMLNKDVAERQKLLYTGITRSSHLLTLNNVP